MIHQYKKNGYNIVLDVASGSVHVVDDLAYDVISYVDNRLRECESDESSLAKGEADLAEARNPYMAALNKEELTIGFIEAKRRDTSDNKLREEVGEIIDEVIELAKGEELFTIDRYESRIEAYSSRESVVKALCLHVAHDCNLACKYCFAGKGEYQGSKEIMSFEVGKKAIDFLVSNSGGRRNLEVDFFGGEPLLNLDVVKKIVDYARSIESSNDKHFRFTLTTNGVLLDDDTMSYLNDTMDNVVLSLDGRKAVHDKMRPFPSGAPSYDVVVDRFIKFAKMRGSKSYYVRGTYTHNNLDFAEDVMHLASLGFKQISVEPVVAPPGDEYALREEDLEKLYEEYDKLAREIVARSGTDDEFNFFHYMIDLEGGPCVYKRLSGCGSGTEYLAVTPGGDLYPCHQFVGNSDFRMGDVDTGIVRDDLRDKFKSCNVYAKPECKDCFARFYCSGGCAANSYNYAGDILGNYEIGCKLQRARVEAAIMIKAATN